MPRVHDQDTTRTQSSAEWSSPRGAVEYRKNITPFAYVGGIQWNTAFREVRGRI